VPGIKGQETGVHVSWLREEFHECPPDADKATVTMYARAWVWHIFATVLFPDSTGCQSGFVTLPLVPLQEQPAMVLLLEGALVSWSLAMNECGGHKDLRGLGRRRVIPYVHGRTRVVMLKPDLPEPTYLSALVKRCLPGPFIAQGRVVILRPGARQVAPWWLKPYTTSRALMARRS
jgi:hypothetical protein